MDGLKPGQRKVLYACFRRRLTKEIKVAQLAGYVAEHTNYHHGEQSLATTIISMAQVWCFSFFLFSLSFVDVGVVVVVVGFCRQ
jgi:DNA gyrase/topoisomerase IV subunit A